MAETWKSRSGPKSVAGYVDRLTRRAFASRGFADAGLITRWPEIVGEVLARRTRPEKIVYARGERAEGTLVLRVDGGAMATELTHEEPRIVERINAYFGYRAVSRLRIIQGPVESASPAPETAAPKLDDDEEEAVEKAVESIRSAELKDVLNRLGKAVAVREKMRRER